MCISDFLVEVMPLGCNLFPQDFAEVFLGLLSRNIGWMWI